MFFLSLNHTRHQTRNGLHWSTTPGNGASPRVWLIYPVRLSKRKSLPPQLWITDRFLARGGTLCPPPLLKLEFGLASVCTGPVHALTVPVSSCVHLPWYVLESTLSLELAPSWGKCFYRPMASWERGWGNVFMETKVLEETKVLLHKT